jgi:hypothetical protein
MNVVTGIAAEKKIEASRDRLSLFKAVSKVDVANANILPCSVERFRQHETQQARMRELRKTIEARYAEQLATAGWWKRICLWRLINVEYRREAERVGPSPYAL